MFAEFAEKTAEAVALCHRKTSRYAPISIQRHKTIRIKKPVSVKVDFC